MQHPWKVFFICTLLMAPALSLAQWRKPFPVRRPGQQQDQNQIVLQYFGQEFKQKTVLHLKQEIKDKLPGMKLAKEELKRVVLFAKSRQGNGKASLKVGNCASDEMNIDGRPYDFPTLAKDSFFKIVIKNDCWQDKGVWQIHMQGNIKVDRVVVHLGEDVVAPMPPRPIPGPRPPRPTPRPRPIPTPVYSDYKATITPGETVYNISRDAWAQVIAVEYDGDYVLRFTSGSLAGQTGSGWSRSSLALMNSCKESFCTGQEYYNTSRDAFVKIVAIEYDGDFVLEFTSGSLSGQVGDGWSQLSLATLHGCSHGFCVGDRAFNTSRNTEVEIVAIERDGDFVLKFLSGSLAGQIGDGWSMRSLARYYH